ncbi:AAA family ATPase [Escherichia coli]
MIALIGSNKGGPGKSTTAINVAVGLALRGKDVCYLDADAQASGRVWHSFREEAGLTPAITLVQGEGNISRTLRQLDDKYDFVIVDVAGRNSREFITGGTVADLIIAPHLSSQLDLSTLDELQMQLEGWQDINPDLALKIYHTRATTNPLLRANERAEFLAFMSNYPTLPVLDATNSERKVFRDAITEGKGVLEMTGKSAEAAKDEVTKLIDEVFTPWL